MRLWPESRSVERRFRVRAVAALAACSLPAAACTAPHQGSSPPVSPTPSAMGVDPDAMVLQVMPAPYQLPAAVSREVVLPGANGLLIVGGLTPEGASTETVTALDPATGVTRQAARLAAPTHDAA